MYCSVPDGDVGLGDVGDGVEVTDDKGHEVGGHLLRLLELCPHLATHTHRGAVKEQCHMIFKPLPPPSASPPVFIQKSRTRNFNL